MTPTPISTLAKLFKADSRVITYQPTSSEVSPTEIFPAALSLISYTVPPIATSDPFEECAAAGRAVKEHPTVIFVPGRAFDAAGTRHGKGLGWYDRFLSVAPREWIRIGFCYSEQFSSENLVRESWDEPMNFVCVLDKESGMTTCHETFARTKDGLVY